MFDLFKNERKKWATPIDGAQLRRMPTPPGFNARSREFYGTALPRGVLLPRLEADRERINYWMSPAELIRWASSIRTVRAWSMMWSRLPMRWCRTMAMRVRSIGMIAPACCWSA